MQVFIRRTALLVVVALFFLGCVLTHSNLPPGNQKTPKLNQGPANQSDSEKNTAVRSLKPIGTHDFPEIATIETTVASSSAADESPSDTVKSTARQKKIQRDLDEALEYCQVAQESWQKGELEHALEALDEAYRFILKVDTEDSPKLTQDKEDLRFLISKRILEIYASRNIVVNGNRGAIPMVMNRHIQTELKRFTTGRDKRFFIESYKRSGRFRPAIVAALQEAGLPEELSWLPLIESGFKTHALSRARALGLWQFIPSTGYKFGLKRDVYIDERLDPQKATKAAIAYLKELHQIFGDWATVLAAYNCGEGRVLRIIRSQNVNYLDNFWDLYEKLPRETARYVPKFMATLHIVKNPEKYGLTNLKLDTPLEYETVTVHRRVRLKDIARHLATTESELRKLNPELRYKVLPNESYALNVPMGKGNLLLSAIDQIPVTQEPRRAFVYHRVRAGETLSTIARRYRTRVASIMRANKMRRSNFIRIGQRLKIPQRGMVVLRATRPVRRTDSNATQHIVARGDSLWNIARRYGTTTKKIQAVNNLNHTRLHIGQVLLLPGSGNRQPAQASSEVFKTYRVQAGDSPFAIAQRHNMSLTRFLKINRLTSRTRIYPGQQFYVD